MKIKFSKYLYLAMFVSVLFFGAFAFAEEGAGAEHHQSVGIPRIVFYQALNFFGLLAILFYFSRKKVGAFFEVRHDTLAKALVEAKKVREDAEKKHQEYTVKIQNLEREAGGLIEQIKRDGEESKKRIIEEARVLARTIEEEAQRSVKNEIEKAKAELYDDVLEQALNGARSMLVSTIAVNDQKRLQKEFVEKIEAVQ